MELAARLELVTCCLQDSCATDCATPARRPFPLVGGPLATEGGARIRHPLLIYVHCVCNQVRGTVHGLLSDGTDQEAMRVSRDGDACVTEQLAPCGAAR